MLVIMLATVLTKRNRCNFWQEFLLVPYFCFNSPCNISNLLCETYNFWW